MKRSYESREELVISYLSLRRLIGWLGILLPVMLITLNALIIKSRILFNTKYFGFFYPTSYQPGRIILDNLSDYYYSPVSELFTAIICTTALFLFCYKGYRKSPTEKGLSDNFLTNIAGIAALGLVFIPATQHGNELNSIRIYYAKLPVGIIHYSLSMLFFLSLSILAMVNFRRQGKTEGLKKDTYGLLYLICGIGMLLCIILIGLYTIWLKKIFPIWTSYNLVFWLEVIALICFGLAWLVKGRLLKNMN